MTLAHVLAIWGLSASLVVLAVFDCLSTLQAFKRGAREVNPLMAWVMQVLPRAWPFLRVAVALVVVGLSHYLFWHRGLIVGPIFLLVAVVALTGWAVKNNYAIAWGHE